MKATKDSLIKTSFKLTRERFLIDSLPLSFFAIIGIVALIVGFYLPISLLLTIPFLLIPSFFSLSAINTIAANKNAHEGVGFFVMFRAYFTQIFFGGYRILFGYLKALLTLVVSFFVFSAIFSSTILYNNPEYIALVEKAKEITDLTELFNLFYGNSTFVLVMNLTYCCSFFCCFYLLAHHFAVNSFKYNYNFTAKLPLPMQDLKLIDSVVLKKNRKSFYKAYYSAFWFLGLILIVGYALGVSLTMLFVPQFDFVQISVVGIFGSFILLLFFTPYFLNGSQVIFMAFKKHYIETFMDLSKQSLEELRKTKNITDEKEKEVLSIIESEKEDKDNTEENNSNE